MKSQVLARAAGLLLAVVIALATYGCGKKAGIHLLIPNERPTVTLTSAPVDTRDTAFYAYRLSWSGDDPDGRVDHYVYAIDPKAADTTWMSTTKNENTFFFRSMNPIPTGRPGDRTRSIEPHTFVIKAIDNAGLGSVPTVRSFFSFTVAPTVNVISPVPSDLLLRMMTPSMRVSWQGQDFDGQFTQKPIKYKYKLFANGNGEFDYNLMRQVGAIYAGGPNGPDSLRRFYAKTNFAGWDSVGGDTTSVQFTGLIPQKQYVFVVIGYDEAGAYSPLFSLTGNMLNFEVGFAGTLGPKITAFNESMFYSMPSGGFAPNNPVTWVHMELPASRKFTLNWVAEPPPGALMQWYRWRVNGDVFDETPRTNENDDWFHWSAKSAGTTSCTIGPFQPNVQYFLYIEAMDNNGLLSLLTIVLHPVEPTFANDLLIVDDTRLEVDKTVGGVWQDYLEVWPAAAELDTFLYARGGVPWRGTKVPVSAVPQPVSYPGLFAGYSFDTLGTRQGLQVASTGVPLSKLGQYRHVIWMVDHYGGANLLPANDSNKPMSALAYMAAPNHMNTLGSYMLAGGSVWLCGGAAAYASLRDYNKPVNDDPGIRVRFSNLKGELLPGRMMYDGARWQNEMTVQAGVAYISTNVYKTAKMPPPWTSPGWNYEPGRQITSPNYNNLPAQMRKKALAIGDTLPPTRYGRNPAYFYSPATYDVEYLSQDNRIIEDFDPDPSNVREASALDTLMDVKGPQLPNLDSFSLTPFPVMTYYHGVNKPEFVFSGFNFWMWNRADDLKLVDFVLQDVWKLPHNSSLRWAPQSKLRPFVQSPANVRPGAIPDGAASRLPKARTAGR
jgi:hypothetical protein